MCPELQSNADLCKQMSNTDGVFVEIKYGTSFLSDDTNRLL